MVSETLSAKIGFAKTVALDHGPHGTIENKHTFFEVRLNFLGTIRL